MDNYMVKDTSEYKIQFYLREPLKIWLNKITPLKIDIFKSNDEIKGTITIANYQKVVPLDVINEYYEIKSDLKNIHIVNDTLVADYEDVQFKLAKSGNDYFFVTKSDSAHIKQQECNKFATSTKNTISYKAIIDNSNAASLIKQSNDCDAEKRVTAMLAGGYKKEKATYLKSILSVEPKINR
jgi:hypothetical protein